MERLETLPVSPTSDRKKAYLRLKPLQQAQTPEIRGVCWQWRWLDRAHRSQWEEDHGSPRMLREPGMSHTSLQLFLKQLVC